MLKIKNLTHSYDHQNSISYPDWEVNGGHNGLIIGNSGCGKTTLLHLIGGLMPPKSGVIEIDGDVLSEKKGNSLDQFRGSSIGIVFQKPHLIRSLTVRENLSLAQYLSNKRQDVSKIMKVLEDLGIADLAKRKVHQISQGQAQRVSVARAVINSPKLLLADEPTASLDDESCQKAIGLLKTQAEATGATLIVATHDHRVKNEFENQLSL